MQSAMRRAIGVACAAAAAGYFARGFVRQSRWFDFAEKRVVISGGSRGLGLEIARQLCAAGARVAICARTDSDLQRASQELHARGGAVEAWECDVTDELQVGSMVNQVVEKFGGVDVLFNVAGIIEVGPLDAMTKRDFQRSMDTHFWGTLHTSLAVIPLMRRQNWGRIVNVASLGGKRAVPHMLPYSGSKFAQVGLSNGLRTELAQDGIFVTTACPSLMRTGSPRNAMFKGQHRKEYAWFSIGDALPGVSMKAEQAAGQIIRACQYGDGEVIVASPLNFGVMAQTAFPELTRTALTFLGGLLPQMGGIGQKGARGYESESCWSPSVLTTLSEKAAVRNNEMQPREAS